MSATVQNQVRIDCPGCEKEYYLSPAKLPDQSAKASCKNCGEKISIPSHDEYAARVDESATHAGT